jgi:hypothetical protein
LAREEGEEIVADSEFGENNKFAVDHRRRTSDASTATSRADLTGEVPSVLGVARVHVEDADYYFGYLRGGGDRLAKYAVLGSDSGLRAEKILIAGSRRFQDRRGSRIVRDRCDNRMRKFRIHG